MKIATYLKRKNLTQKQFAEMVGVSPGLISIWINGRIRISADCARDIHKATKGEIGLHEMRPDLWEPAIYGRKAA